jgi:hypothetical protein
LRSLRLALDVRQDAGLPKLRTDGSIVTGTRQPPRFRAMGRSAGFLMLAARPAAAKILISHQPRSIWPGKRPIFAEPGKA